MDVHLTPGARRVAGIGVGVIVVLLVIWLLM
jgi:hypothetical protein